MSKAPRRIEAVWRFLRVAVWGFAHTALVGSLAVHTSWAGKTGIVAALVGASETLYRLIFPQGSHRVTAGLARALLWAQKAAQVAQGLAQAVDPAIAPTIARIASEEAAVNSVATTVLNQVAQTPPAPADPGQPAAGTQPPVVAAPGTPHAGAPAGLPSKDPTA